MELSRRGLELIKRYEGLELRAYPDPGTGGKPYTIGYGTTRIDGRPVVPGMTITEQEAERYLAADVAQFAKAVNRAVTVPINQNQRDALISLTYNIGIGAFKRSTLLRRLNAGDTPGAAAEFERWIHAGGRVMAGLVKRRKEERALFETPCSTPQHWYEEIETGKVR